MAKRKPFTFGKNDRRRPCPTCDECGGPMKANVEGISVCSSCAPREKRRKRLPEKSEDIDRDEDDDERAEFRDAYLETYFGGE